MATLLDGALEKACLLSSKDKLLMGAGWRGWPAISASLCLCEKLLMTNIGGGVAGVLPRVPLSPRRRLEVAPQRESSSAHQTRIRFILG